MRRTRSCLGFWPGLLALVFTTGAAAAGPAAAGGDSGDLQHLRQDEQCSQIGTVFYRLAEQRQAGADEKTAARRVSEWSASLAQTGSHYVRNNSAAVGDAAHLVFRLKDLNSIALGAFGKNSCVLQFAYEKDENRKTAGMVQLIGAARDCQKKNPGEVSNHPLSECIRLSEVEIAEKLKTARVNVR